MKKNSNNCNSFKLPILFSFLLLLLLSCDSSKSKDKNSEFIIDEDAQPQEVVADAIEDGFFPALAVAVIRESTVQFQAVEGERKAGSNIAVQSGDAFHFGSNTKAMSALLCGMLVDQGLLGWDTTIGEILGNSAVYDASYSDVTLTELLSHTSGIHNDISKISFDSYFTADTGEEMIKSERKRLSLEVMSQPLNTAQRGSFLYSNFNYIIAGYLLETLSGKSWESLMQENLFTPMNLASAGFGPCCDTGETSGLWGHSPDPVTPGIDSDNPQPFGPAGRVHMNLADTITYLSIYFDRGVAAAGKELISQSALDKITTVVKDDYALGWGIFVIDGDIAMTHDGSNTLNYASFLVFPRHKSAVIVMTNIGSDEVEQNVNSLMRYFNNRYLKDIFVYP